MFYIPRRLVACKNRVPSSKVKVPFSVYSQWNVSYKDIDYGWSCARPVTLWVVSCQACNFLLYRQICKSFATSYVHHAKTMCHLPLLSLFANLIKGYKFCSSLNYMDKFMFCLSALVEWYPSWLWGWYLLKCCISRLVSQIMELLSGRVWKVWWYLSWVRH